MSAQEAHEYQQPEDPPPGWYRTIEDAAHAAALKKHSGEYQLKIKVLLGSHIRGWQVEM